MSFIGLSFTLSFAFTAASAFLLVVPSRTLVTSVLLRLLLVLFILVARISSTSRFSGKFPTVLCFVGSPMTDFTTLETSLFHSFGFVRRDVVG